MGVENWEELCAVAEKVKMGQDMVNKGKTEVTKERQFSLLNTSVVEKIRHYKGSLFPAALGKVDIPFSTACLISHSQSHVQSCKSIMAFTKT